MDKRVGELAVVLSGSRAGLLAARVLSEPFDEVLVDPAPAPPASPAA